MQRLQRWLEEQCEANNWSWREASLKAKLNPGAISAIITGGQRPGLETCKALAKLFRVSTVFVLQMAGHVENTPINHPALLDPQFQEVMAAWQFLSDHDAIEQLKLIHGLAVQLQRVEAALIREAEED